jgi:hypothetical protein
VEKSRIFLSQVSTLVLAKSGNQAHTSGWIRPIMYCVKGAVGVSVRGCAMNFRRMLLATVALVIFAGAVIPAHAAGHPHHRHHPHRHHR